MVSKKPNARFEWERAVIGKNGPRSPTMRHVLHVIATHVPSDKDYAYPSLRTLEAETALSRQCVVDQLRAAVAQGWLRRELTRVGDMRYRGNVYYLAVPASGQPRLPVGSGSSGQPRRPDDPGVSGQPRLPGEASYPQAGAGGQPEAAGGQRGDASGQRGSAQVVNVVGCTSSFNTKFQHEGDHRARAHAPAREAEHEAGKYPGPENTKSNGNGKSKSARQWAEELGLVRGPGESELAWLMRARKAGDEVQPGQRKTTATAEAHNATTKGSR